MKTAAIFFCAIVLCVHAISDDEVRRQWQEFQETYHKSYRSPVETRKRFTIFKQHLEEIEAHNKLYDEGKVTWKEGVNKFADWTEDELKEYINRGLLNGDVTVRSMPTEDQEIQRKWNEFQKTYGKSYRSPVEAKKRFEIFKKNVIRIEEHNKLYEQGLVSDKEAINQFADWTEEEFEAYEKRGIIPEETAPSSEDVEIERKWSEFQKTYKKSYRSPVEAKKRFEIFKKNVIRIEEHNDLYEQGLVSDKEGINQFSDWTEEEFEAYEKRGIIPKETVLSSEDAEIQRKWNEFQKTYKKSYRSTVEAKKRFEIFKKNVIRIEEHNDLYEQGLVSDKQGINKFADLTEEEFQDYVKKGLILKDSTVRDSDDEDMMRRFKDFQKKYNKSYKSAAEEKKRFEIFKENVRKIDEHNAQYYEGKTTFLQEVNQFSDWTHQEMIDWLIGH
ncbi:trophozoite cysteine proteinase-like isoform X1 [Coccinella septempunctata]|uniref:trophozoite cysteine proteinase-like isoform X1 n=1 Tax=Coccinella septempunctata TaxID=41139 RepID=UPI001D060C96|nr:trophozoite cysteine proteinase-like isoform X1 [Coccinella septempunctata]